ncbi:hypothetical protein BDV95DRAFT_319043 [Massariosphaeria phaeospora]|uniref:Nephrocystin 3-like N-terminal domain-containing protein n=1 Tax=Massariosphaeria phaeospora TaxID=100035 RepID=A0A7C8MBX8_9PLEO|nr:hypothetical protein BDV95DRAFT_319043 [Massariosphaeria phaeospora]
MEGVAAFALACGVMQTISFGLEITSLCRRLYENKSPAPGADKLRSGLQTAAQNLNRSVISTPTPVAQKEERQLQTIAKDLIDIVEELQKELDKAGSGSQPSRRKALGKALKYTLLGGKSKVEELEKCLKNSQNAMETHILIALREKTEVIETATRGGFDSIDRQLQDFLIHLEDGQLTLSKLIDRESGEVRSVVREEAERTRAHLNTHFQATNNAVATANTDTKSHIDAHRSAQVSDNQLQTFKRSLEYPEMNARRNMAAINDIHEGTFHWVLHEATTDNHTPLKWPSFTEWLRSEEKTYWICGKPGSGKSSLIRFLLDETDTKIFLQQWKSDAEILSSFIWEAGSPMQRSQKGILASLLHQLLEISAEAAIPPSTNSATSSKVFLSDWSMSALRVHFLHALDMIAKPVCIFIDGLDEIDQQEFDGSIGLLNLIDNIAAHPNVKLCLGSREEGVFIDKLSAWHRLRLQDLTNSDIRKHVDETLINIEPSPVGRPLSEKELSELADMIVERAQGVFLWANYVTKSIRRGLFASDHWNQLRQRIEDLPGNVEALYLQMWNRLNKEDKHIYRKDSALYFRLVLDERPSLFQMLLCSAPALLRAFLAGGSEITEEYLLEQFTTFQRQLLARCANLVEISFNKGNHDRGPLGQLCSRRTEVTFIHKSAHAFLKDTPDGRWILEPEKRKAIELRYLAELSVIPDYIISNRASAWHHLNLLEDYLLERPPHTDSLEVQLLNVVASALMRSPWAQEDEKHEHYFVKLSAWAGSMAYVKAYIQDPPAETSGLNANLKSELLAYTCQKLWYKYAHTPGEDSEPWLRNVPLVSWLLAENADCNMPFLVSVSGTYQTAFITFLLVFDQYLESSLTRQDLSTIAPQLLKLLSGFLEHGADTETRICLSVGELGHRLKYGSCWQHLKIIGFGDLLYVTAKMKPCDIFYRTREALSDCIDQYADYTDTHRLEKFLNNISAEQPSLLYLEEGETEDVVQWLVEHGPIPPEIALAYDPKTALVEHLETSIPSIADFSHIDWSYNPDYDKLIATPPFDRIFPR